MTRQHTYIHPAGFQPRNNKGLTLIELMVALALGIVLIAGLLQVISANRMTYMTGEGISRIQEDGRFALERIRSDLREATGRGFCAARVETLIHITGQPRPGESCGDWRDEALRTTTSVMGWEAAGTGIGDEFELPINLSPDAASAGNWSTSSPSGAYPLPVGLQGRLVPDSDVLLVKFWQVLPGRFGNVPDPAVSAFELARNDGDSTDPILFWESLGVRSGDLILMVDCSKQAELFQLADDMSSKEATACASTELDWSFSYDGDRAGLYRQQLVAWHVGYNSARGEPGLYRTVLHHDGTRISSQEVASGVESLQLEYGVGAAAAAGGDGQSVARWVTADAVMDWSLVFATRFSLLVSSHDNVGPESVQDSFWLGKTRVTNQATDNQALDRSRRLRKAFTATVAHRNTILVSNDIN